MRHANNMLTVSAKNRTINQLAIIARAVAKCDRPNRYEWGRAVVLVIEMLTKLGHKQVYLNVTTER